MPTSPARPALAVLILAFLLALLGPVRAWALPQVSGLRFGFEEPRTRVVLDLGQPLSYRVAAQADPAQVVVDLGPVDWRLGDPAAIRPRGLARGHEFDRTLPDRARLVIATSRPVRVVGTIVLPPSKDSVSYRLVINLVAADRGGAPRPAPAPASAGGPVDGVVPLGAAAAAASVAAPVSLPAIVIDPGHGGADPGAIAVNGAFEKDIVLEMALELRRLIGGTGRYRVELTRDRDASIGLRDRIARARELGGRVFISLHADSLRSADQRGASVYTLSETASDEEAARLASQENKADILAGTDLSLHDAAVASILLDLAQRDTNNRSIGFADRLAEELAAVTPMLRRYRRFAGFAVLKSPDIPSVLLELGYLSNADDARNLAQSDYRAKVSRAIVRAVDRFFAVPRT